MSDRRPTGSYDHATGRVPAGKPPRHACGCRELALIILPVDGTSTEMLSIESERTGAAQARAQAEQELQECQALEEELAHVHAVLAKAGASFSSGTYDPGPLLRQSALCRELEKAYLVCPVGVMM